MRRCVAGRLAQAGLEESPFKEEERVAQWVHDHWRDVTLQYLSHAERQAA